MPTGRLPAPPLLSRSLLWQSYFLHISKLNKTIFSSARLAALEQPQDSRAWTAHHCLSEQGSGKRQKWGSCLSPMSEPVLNSPTCRDLPKPTPQHLMAGQVGDSQVWAPIWPQSPPQPLHTPLRLRWEGPAEQKLCIIAKSAPSCPKASLYPFEGPTGSPADWDSEHNAIQNLPELYHQVWGSHRARGKPAIFPETLT